MGNWSRKNLIAGIILLLLPTLVWANCPDLTGDYRCRVLIFAKNIRVAKLNNQGSAAYLVDGVSVVVDGREHFAAEPPSLMARFVRNVRYTATCANSRLDFKGNGILKRSLEEVYVEGSLEKNSEETVIIRFAYQTLTKKRGFTAKCSARSSRFWNFLP